MRAARCGHHQINPIEIVVPLRRQPYMNAASDVKTRMQTKVGIIATVEAQQKDHPDFCSGLLEALIASELRMLLVESGIASAEMLPAKIKRIGTYLE